MGHITFMKPVGSGVSWIFSTVVAEPLGVRTKVFTYELPSSSLVVTAKRRGGSFSVTSPSIRLSGLRGSQPKDSNVEPTAFGSPESQFARYGFGDQSCELTGWTRRHARRALVEPATKPRSTPRHRRVYGQEVLGPLRFVWATLGGPAGKRLAPFMQETIEALERHGEIDLLPEVRTKLLSVSAATIDRMLAPERAKLRMKGRSGTKPGSILRRQIPIRTFAEWADARPGFC